MAEYSNFVCVYQHKTQRARIITNLYVIGISFGTKQKINIEMLTICFGVKNSATINTCSGYNLRGLLPKLSVGYWCSV